MAYNKNISAMRVHLQNMTEVLDDLEQMQLTDVLELQLCEGSKSTEQVEKLQVENESLKKELAEVKEGMEILLKSTEQVEKLQVENESLKKELGETNKLMRKAKEEDLNKANVEIGKLVQQKWIRRRKKTEGEEEEEEEDQVKEKTSFMMLWYRKYMAE